MYPWMRLAFVDAKQDPDFIARILRERDAIDRLVQLDLKDRWGYPLQAYKLVQIVEAIRTNVDTAALRRRGRESAVVTELADRLAMEMLVGSVPQFCDDYDTPASDELVEIAVRAVLNIKKSER